MPKEVVGENGKNPFHWKIQNNYRYLLLISKFKKQDTSFPLKISLLKWMNF